jgi:uncharacterized peroxidase-related enzyme
MAHVQPLNREDLSQYEEEFRVIESVMGFLPNSILTMARRPEIMQAWNNLARVVLGPGELPFALKQMVAQVASRAAGCRYCQAHTASNLDLAEVDTEKIAQLWEFDTSDLFSDAERAALRLGRDAALIPNAVTKDDFTELRRHYDDSQLVELLATIALFGYLNRWNDTMATQLEQRPLAFGERSLAQVGWEPGKHG